MNELFNGDPSCASGYIKSFKSRFLKITEIWLSNPVIFDGAWGLLSDPDRLFVSAAYKVGSNTSIYLHILVVKISSKALFKIY